MFAEAENDRWLKLCTPFVLQQNVLESDKKGRDKKKSPDDRYERRRQHPSYNFASTSVCLLQSTSDGTQKPNPRLPPQLKCQGGARVKEVNDNSCR